MFIIYVFTYDFIFYFVKIIIFHTLLSLYLTTERLKEDEVEEVQCTYNHQNFRLLPLRTAPPTRPSGARRFLLQIAFFMNPLLLCVASTVMHSGLKCI